MICDSVAHWKTYLGLSERLDKALCYIAENDLTAMADGSYVIDENGVNLRLSSYVTKSPEDAKIEAHREFLDIQLVLDGEEIIRYGLLEEMDRETEAHPDRDLYFYAGPTQPAALFSGKFLILFPTDVHGPGICLGQPSPVRKALVKVRL